MPLRQATYADLLPASKILGAAFKEDPLAGKYQHPYRNEHPEGMSLWYLRKLRVAYCCGPDHHIMVAYTNGEDGKEDCITGIIHWVRQRRGPSQDSWYIKARVQAMQNYNYLESFVYPDRAADPSRLNALQGIERYTGHHWSGTRAETWYIALLATDPAYRKQGYGRELVKYGFDRAREEGMGCSVVGSEGSYKFYETCGFDVMAGFATDELPEDSPIKNLGGGQIRFWDGGKKPEGIKRYGEA